MINVYTTLFFILFASHLWGADSIPVSRTNITDDAETKVVEVLTPDTVDRLAVDAFVSGGDPSFADGSFANILKQSEINVTTKVETDLAGTTYTVPAGKSFAITSFGGSYDTQSPMYLRFKKQTGGTGSFDTLLRVTLKQHGQDESNFHITPTHGIKVGVAGDVFKITFDSALSKGSLWSGFSGVEY